MNELVNACNLLGWNTRVKGEEILVEVCPFCGNARWNFQLSDSKACYHCWSCDAKGTLRGLSKFFPLGSAAKSKKFTQEKTEAFGLTKEDVDSLKIFEKFCSLNKLDKSEKIEVENFLQNRGISLDEATGYKIKYSTAKINIDLETKKRYNNRVIVPLFDISGNLVYFVGRSVEKDATLKYVNCEVKRKRFLPVYLGKEQPNTVLLVEGVFDAIAVHQAGFSAIPLLSMSISDLQIFALLGIGFEKIVIALDPGEFDSSNNLYQKLTKVGLKPYVFLRGGEDFDLVARDEIKTAVNSLLLTNPDTIRDQLLQGRVTKLLSKRR